MEHGSVGAQERENPDPTEVDRPIPWLVLSLVGLLFGWGITYILMQNPKDDPALGDSRTLSTLQAKPAGSPGGAVDGAQIYSAQCVACHQATGAGLPGVFPPLAGSEWVMGSDKVAAAILLHGITGKLTVKGGSYNGQMPAFKDKLNDAEIAAVLSHIRSNFGNAAPKIAPDVVKAEREATRDRKDPWAGDDDLVKLK
ncbi:c-type cytochrome [Pseudoduganella sp. UC29_106]|uniref:c-type cytochrome n=1 Tax=Pseudoduganella sp. UC29_106 TaxID=3374553 RepID=UPI00375793C6